MPVNNDSPAEMFLTQYSASEEERALEFLRARSPAPAADPFDEINPPPMPTARDFSRAADTVGSVASDVAMGTTIELPRAISSGTRNAAQSFLDLTDTAGDWLNENVVDLGRPQMFDAEGNFDPKLFAEAKPDATGVTLPGIDAPDSVTGNAISAITQFLVPFGLAGKAFKSAGVMQEAGILRPALQGAIADFTAFGGHEDTLAELVQSVPGLANPVTEFLSTDEGESEIGGRIKNTLEGLGLGSMTDALLRGLRAYKAGKQVQEGGASAADAAPAEPPKPFTTLGDVDDPRIVSDDAGAASEVPPDVAAERLAKSRAEVAGMAFDLEAGKKLVDTARRFKAATSRLIKDEPVTLDDLNKLDQEAKKVSVEVDDVVEMVRAAREGPKSPPKRLTQFLVEMGGLRDEGGDLRAMLGTVRSRPGLINNTNGTPLDDAAMAATEQGFFPGMERATINDLLDAVGRDMGGEPVVKADDHNALLNFEAADAARQELDRLGVSANLRSDDRIREMAALALDPDPRVGRMRGDLPEGVRLRDTSVEDAHGGEMFGTKSLEVDGESAVIADLSILPDEVRIQNIGTSPNQRRQGLATALVDDLFREFPDRKISISGTTDDGAQFFGNRFDIDENGFIVPKLQPGNEAQTLSKGERELLGGNEIYINFARINTEDDIRSVIGQMADRFAGDIDKARGGVRTFKQTRLEARDVDAFEALLERRQGTIPNDSTQLAMRELWIRSGKKLKEVIDEAALNPSDENVFSMRKMVGVHSVIQREIFNIRADTARALNAWRIDAGAGPQFRQRQLEDAIAAFGGTEVNRKLAQRMAVAMQEGGMEGLDKMVEKGVGARTLEAVQEVWINFLLSGFKTHLVNMMSNTSIVGLRIAERAVASRISKAMGTDAGVEIGEASAMSFGVLEGFKDGLRYAGRTLRTGETGHYHASEAAGGTKLDIPIRERSVAASNFGLRQDSALGKAADLIGAGVNMPGRFLAAEDELFKTIGYRSELNAQAHRIASKEVRDGAIPEASLKARVQEIVSDPPESVQLAAVDSAAYQTFTNRAGAIAQIAQRSVAEVPLLRFVLPFTNTPANIMSFTFERTPLAPLMGRFRADVAAGGARKDLALAQLGLGSMTLFAGIDLAMNGSLTGGGPGPGPERNALYRRGWQPYSLRVDDRYFAFNRLDPIGLTLGLAGDVFEILAARDWDSSANRDVSEVLSIVTASIAKNLTEKTFFSGIAGMFEMLSDPDRYAETFFKRFAGSFVPTLVKDIAQINDPVMRATHDWVSQVKSRTPILSESVPPRRDLWGREISFSSGLGEFYDVISPIYSRRFEPEPIDKLMAEQGWFVGMPSKRLLVDGEYVNLRERPDVYSRYLELQGNALKHPILGAGAKDLLNSIVEGNHPLSGRFSALSDGDEGGKEKFIRNLMSQYRRLAREQIIQEFPELRQEAASLRAEKGLFAQ